MIFAFARFITISATVAALTVSASADFRSDVASGAARGHAQFNAIYPQSGVSGAQEAIRDCYAALNARSSAGDLAQCAGHHIAATNANDVMSRAYNLPAQAYLSAPKIQEEINRGLMEIGLGEPDRPAFEAAVMTALDGTPRSAGAAAPAAAETIDLAELKGYAYMHNGSSMLVLPEQGLIVYQEPKKSISDVVRPGVVLFKGAPWKLNGKRATLRGRAFVFKKGCAPAAYDVRGVYGADDKIMLEGAAPVRAKTSCEIIGHKPGGANGVLRFEDAWGDV